MSTDESEDAPTPAPFQFRNTAARGTATLPDPGTEPEPEAEPAPEPAAEHDSEDPVEPEQRRAPRVASWAWAVLTVALVAAVLAFFSWRSADTDPERDRAALRDSAVIEGTTAVETMTSMDHRDVAAGLKAWQSVSTGVLHDQLVSVGKDEQQMLADQGKIATGRVVDAALTKLTDRTATLIVAVEVTVREDDKTQEPAVKRNRFSADLVRVGDQWKIENLQQVAVGT